MAEPESWQISTDAAEIYESCFVPAIFGAWSGPVAESARILPGQRVLDVACGTGVLAREALRRSGESGNVVGLDINKGMLAVAARIEPKIEWWQGDAGSLPFEDDAFDAVVSQFALMYFPDRVSALREMWRVLAPGGRVAVAVWASIKHSRGYRILAEIADRQCGREAADVLVAPFVLGDQSELSSLFVEAGILSAHTDHVEGSIRFPSAKEFIRIEVKGSPLAEMLNDEEMDALAVASEAALAEYVEPSGEIVMPMNAHIVTANKR